MHRTFIGDLQQALTLSGRGNLMSGYITEGLEMVDRAVGDLTIDTDLRNRGTQAELQYLHRSDSMAFVV